MENIFNVLAGLFGLVGIISIYLSKNKHGQHQETTYKRGDKLFYYFENDIDGKNYLVNFVVNKIYLDVTIGEKREQREFYEADIRSPNYYGRAPLKLVGKTMPELTEKLLRQGYTFDQPQEREIK